MIKICQYCSNKFSCDHNGRKFCKAGCYRKYKHIIDTSPVKCFNCNIEFRQNNYRVKNNKRHFCCKKCDIAYNRKENHYRYSGGIDKQGYVHFLENGKSILAHRRIMEKHIGRKLLNGEIVHHVNHNRLDNRIENLKVMTIGDHSRLHKLGKPREKKHK